MYNVYLAERGEGGGGGWGERERPTGFMPW